MDILADNIFVADVGRIMQVRLVTKRYAGRFLR